MKKIFCIILTFICANNIFAQNVGIGTTTPTEKLSVVNTLPGYGITHTFGPVTMGTYISNLYGQFGTKTNHPLQFFTNNGAAQFTLLQNGNAGINTTSPTEKLHVVGNVLTEGSLAGFRFNDRSDNTKGYQWYSASGNAYLYRAHTPTGNVISVLGNGNIGFNISAPQSDIHVNPAGAGSILIGKDRYTGGYTNLEMGISAQSGGFGYIQSTKASGSTWGTLQLNPSGGDVTVTGYVGIGTNTPFYPLDIVQAANNGDGIALRILRPGSIWGIGDWVSNLFITHNNVTRAIIDGLDGSYNAFSDKRLKKNIEDLSPVLDKVLQLKAKKYQFTDAEESTKKSTGFISQEVVDLFPELVHSAKRTTKDPTLYLSLNYAGFSVIAIKAIQEQQQQIATEKENNKAMLVLIQKMQLEIEALKKK